MAVGEFSAAGYRTPAIVDKVLSLGLASAAEMVECAQA
jgi:hypothetical protein